MSIFSHNSALDTLFTQHIDVLCKDEGLDRKTIHEAIEQGTMVLLGNPAHPNLTPLLVGQPSRIKVNANLGTSPLTHCPHTEQQKLQTALEAGTDTVMDLSIAGDLSALRKNMLAHCAKPVGTVPMYAVGQKLLDAGREIGSMQPDELFTEIEEQAKQGVDFMTVHCGITRRGAQWATEGGRKMGIVSRGGAMLARWMLENDKENPLLTDFDRIINIAREYNVTLSLGDALRPGAGVDAGDAAQFEEVITLGHLASRALKAGVQCMIEGPGHVPMHEVTTQIRAIKRLTNNAPLYVLGPLVVDCAAGHDHIAGAIGGALAVQAGVDFLCYLTPAEHLALPEEQDVHVGVMASRIAAHAGEVALGTPRAIAREAAMNTARANLDWEQMTAVALDPRAVTERRKPHASEEVCAMCGKFCAVKMIKDCTPGKHV